MQKYLLFFLSVFFLSCNKEDTPPPPLPAPIDATIKLVQDEIDGNLIVIVGSAGLNLLTSFERTLEDGTILEFQPVSDELPIILTDGEGNKWDFFGSAVEGARSGQQLKSTRSYIGYWFSWATMYPGVEIFDDATPVGNFEPLIVPPNWTVPTDNVYSGAGLDAIPALENPDFIQYRGRDFLDEEFYVKDDDLVIGVKNGDDYLLYPHAILNWHEIVNDEIGGRPLSISYCPLTGTSLAWDRTIDGQVTTFGVSGFLYNNNLLPYDRNSQSIWSQMLGECINGELISTKLEPFPILETTWSVWKSIIGEPTVLSNDTGYGRNYTTWPYGDYDTNNSYLSFPIDFDDDRLPRKERVLGVTFGEKAKTYRFSSF